MSTFVVQKCTNYFLENGNEIVFRCFLDLSKVYDRGNHALLFMKLMERHTPTFIVKFLRNWYKEQDLYVKWNSSKSASFKTSNGVRQGSVLSPALFNVYVDDLITGSEQSGVGVRINGRFSGGIAYADDLSLLSTSREGMQRLLQICESFATDHCLKFNIQKSKSISFRKRRSIYCRETAFSINGESLPEVHDVIHLGHKLSAVPKETTGAVEERCRKFYSSLYSIVGAVKGVGRNPTVWTTIMYSVLLPVLGYGCELWDLGMGSIKRLLHQAWRRGYRRGLGISNRTSLRETLGEPIREAPDLLRVRQLSFLWRAVHSSNELVSGFILNTQGNLWRSVDNETRTRIMVLSYMGFKSWIKP